MPERIGSVEGAIILDDSQFQQATNRVQNSSKKIDTSFGSMTKSLFTANAAYDVFKKVLSTVTENMKKAISMGSDLQENTSKFNVVFKGVNAEAKAMSKTLVDSYGMSRLEATKTLAAFQDFLVPMGIARKEALDLSGSFTKLAVDIGSFNNAPTAQVLAAIKSGLAGQSEPLRQFGIDISETTLKQMALAQGIELVGNKLDRQSRAQLIYQKITQDSTDALGDFGRTADQFANLGKILESRIENIYTSLGAFFIPALEEVRRKQVEVTSSIDDFLNKTENMEIINNIIAKTTARFQVLGDIVENFTSKVFENFKNIFVAFQNQFGDAINQANIGSVIIQKLSDIFDALGKRIKLASDITVFYINIYGNLFKIISSTGTLIKETFKLIFNLIKQVLPDMTKIFSNIRETALFTGAQIGQFFKGILSGVIEFVKFITKPVMFIFDAIVSQINKIIGVVLKLAENIKNVLGKDTFGGLTDSLKKIQSSSGDLAKNMIKDLDKVKNSALDAFNPFDDATEKNKELNNKFVNNYNNMLSKLTASNEEYNNNVIEKEKDKNNEITEEQKKALKEWEGLQEEKQRKTFAYINELAKKYKMAGAESVEVDKWANKEKRKIAMENFQIMVQQLNSFVNESKKLYQQIFDDWLNTQESQLDEMKAKHEEEIEELETQKDNRIEQSETEFEEQSEVLATQREQGIITQAEYDSKIAVLEKLKADKTAQIIKEMDKKIMDQKNKNKKKEDAKARQIFEADKKNKIADVWIQWGLGTLGVWAGAFASIPNPIAAAILGGVMSALLLAQAIAATVTISTQQYVPARQRGGSVTAGESYITGEKGAELFTPVNDGIIFPSDITEKILTGSQGNKKTIVNNVSLKGAVISSDLDVKKITDKMVTALGRRLSYE